MRRSRVRWAVAAALTVAVTFGAAVGSEASSAPSEPGGGKAPSTRIEGPSIRIVTVVKVLGIGWFERMEEGIRRFAARTGVDATMTGPAEASSQQQIRIIRRLIAERPDAITVVPNSPEALEGVLEEARAAGIKVVTHEASTQVNTDVDIEAFNNTAFGARLMDNLARCMRGSGSYVAFVGHRSAQSHMEWVSSAHRRAKTKYPGIRRIGGPIVSLERTETAYQKAKRLLARYPNLEGFEGSSAVDVAGIGRAIREAGLQRQTCVMGTSIPSIAGKFLTDSSVDRIFFWDPALAGEAQAKLALMLVNGETVGPGLDLGLRGYTNLRRIPGSPHGLSGSGWIAVGKANANKYPF